MRILEPNTDKETEIISKNSIYAFVTDYNLIKILKEIKVSPGQHTYFWVNLNPDKCIDISDIVVNGKYCTFDYAINRAVNDSYCTVYEFSSVNEMILSWSKIKYEDKIKTKYEEKKEELDF